MPFLVIVVAVAIWIFIQAVRTKATETRELEAKWARARAILGKRPALESAVSPAHSHDSDRPITP